MAEQSAHGGAGRGVWWGVCGLGKCGDCVVCARGAPDARM